VLIECCGRKDPDLLNIQARHCKRVNLTLLVYRPTPPNKPTIKENDMLKGDGKRGGRKGLPGPYGG